ncbi:MAG: biopolymer transporter ExbD [Planctomycetes bacterium]|nr:biopolymer transporter ExbD [Planctomycetota bacterium]
MKFRNTGGEVEKIDPQMAPMIDIVFQLLIFFMLTLKIVAPEGDFSINMPLGKPAQQTDALDPLEPIMVRLQANEDGSLAQIVVVGLAPLGSGDDAFDRLNRTILRAIGRPGNPLTKEIEVEIDADYNLNYEYSLRAMSACTGRLQLDPKTGKPGVVRYVENIKFTPPKRPNSAGM